MAKYAPANQNGLKPFVVRRSEWGRHSDRIVYAESARAAEYEVKGRQLHVSVKARRATTEDLDVENPDFLPYITSDSQGEPE